MNASRRRSSKAAAEPHDSDNSERAAESAERKTVWLWQQMDQIFGVRWAQNFGNDPLGKYKDADGKQNPRMEQWIDALGKMSWPQLRNVCQKVRQHQAPYQGWLPDLPFVEQSVGRMRAPRPHEQGPTLSGGTWVGRVCSNVAMEWMFSAAIPGDKLRELADLVPTIRSTIKEMNQAYDLTAGTPTPDPDPDDVTAVSVILLRRLNELYPTKAISDYLQHKHGIPSPTKVNSNS